MIFIHRKPLPRRTFLRGAGVSLALPMLDAMMPQKAEAQAQVKRFIGFFYPNGTSPADWQPSGSSLTAGNLSPCLKDLTGFSKEQIWPACGSLLNDITVVTNMHHDVYGADIHSPSLALSAHNLENGRVHPSLDQKLIERQEHRSVYPYLALSASSNTALGQGYISWKHNNATADTDRNPKVVFDRLFGALQGSSAAAEMEIKRKKLLDFVRQDVADLKKKLGQADKLRVDEFENSISELETQLNLPEQTCDIPNTNITSNNWHDKSKHFIDIAVLAMICDLTRVATIQYSDCWGVNYNGYVLGDGTPDAAGTVGVGGYSDHFISHKLGDRDRAKDLDALPKDVARKIADDRVILTSRFKVRRFAYLVDKLRSATTPTGNLLDDSLALYCSENGNGDSHNPRNMPTLIAGRAGGFQTGRIVNANGKHTAALHGAILNRFGFNISSYGQPSESPMPGI